MADPRDLVTKAQVEGWLNSNNPAFNAQSDTVNIPLAITDCSLDWLSFTGRRALNRFVPCNDFFDGAGGDRQFLRDFPAGLVSGVWVNGIAVPAGSISQQGTVTPGWVLDQKRESVSMVGVYGAGYGLGRGYAPAGAYAATGGPLSRTYGGYGFGRPNDNNRQNVQIQYFAGGQIMFAESWTIPVSPGPYTVTVSQAANFWNDLNQVYYSQPQNGQLVQFTPVTSGPTQGQYSVSSSGVYTFNAADAGLPVNISYGFNQAPNDVQMACIMQVCETLFTRKSIGLNSEAVPEAGSTSFSKVARPARVLMVMSKYKRAMVGM